MPGGQQAPGSVPPQLGHCFLILPSVTPARPGNDTGAHTPAPVGLAGCARGGGGGDQVGRAEAFSSCSCGAWDGLCCYFKGF